MYKSAVLSSTSPLLKPLSRYATLPSPEKVSSCPFLVSPYPSTPQKQPLPCFLFLLWISFACFRILYYGITCVRLLLLSMLFLRNKLFLFITKYYYSFVSTHHSSFAHFSGVLLISLFIFYPALLSVWREESASEYECHLNRMSPGLTNVYSF